MTTGAKLAAKSEASPIGVLAIQGSFALHCRALERLEVPHREVRKPRDLDGLDGLILPGGESTVLSLLAREYHLFEPLLERLQGGLPAFGTCAGAILLGTGSGDPPRLRVAPVELERNAYGRQVDSFTAEVDISGFDRPFHAIFIRAPRITQVDPSAQVLARQAGQPILVEQANLLLATFHPELTDDLRIHQHFVNICRAHRAQLKGAAR